MLTPGVSELNHWTPCWLVLKNRSIVGKLPPIGCWETFLSNEHTKHKGDTKVIGGRSSLQSVGGSDAHEEMSNSKAFW